MVNKLIKCKTCGHDMASNAKVCPNCGAKNKKPLWMRAWVWVLVILLAFFAVSFLKGSNHPENTKPTSNPTTNPTTQSTTAPTTTPTTAPTTIPTTEPMTEPTTEPTAAPSTEATAAPTANNVIRPEFKEAMDSYEEFFDEYCEFMKKYAKNPSDLELLLQYASYVSKMSETMEDFEALEDTEMTDAEAIYYLEVSTRISKKLLEASAALGD